MSENLLKNEQVILDTKGKPDYVVLPIAHYSKILQLLEVYGLGQAMLQVETSPRFNKKQALALLENDKN
jgi:hypothetical protein